jgi:thiol-disulfide isomerase/thioredoxin
MKFTTLLCCIALQIVAFAQPKIGEKVPNIIVNTIGNKKVNLQEQKAKLVLIDFWASWCMPCRAAIKKLKPIYATYKSKGFEVFAVSIDESADDWKKAIAVDKTTWIHGIDKGGWNGNIAMQWKIESIPSTFLINDKGVVVAIDPSENELQKILKKELKGL